MDLHIRQQINFENNKPPWYDPINLSQWGRRVFSLHSLLLFTILVVFIFTEFHFDWLEQLVGNYLTTTNGFRPKSGSIWEHGDQIDKAREAMSQYSNQRRKSELDVQRADSLGQVLNNMDGDQEAMISADHFIELFLKLPPAISHEIISPFRLLYFQSDNRWMRTFLEKQDDRLRIYFLDAQNQVLDRIELAPEMLEYVKRGEVAITMALDRLSDFSTHIYPADLFFDVLAQLEDGVRLGVISRPEDLLRIQGRIRRVGISNVLFAEKVDLGFEIEDLDGPKVVLMQGRFKDVIRLQRALDDRISVSRPFSKGDGP